MIKIKNAFAILSEKIGVMMYIPKSIITSLDKWFIVDYGDNWYGLKSGDGISRGVPEGSIEQWRELISAMRSEEEFYSNRLAYEPGII